VITGTLTGEFNGSSYEPLERGVNLYFAEPDKGYLSSAKVLFFVLWRNTHEPFQAHTQTMKIGK
jgi:hypothetical protein